MERKIGEIFEYNGEWYQCVKSPDGSCKHCDMNFDGKCPIPIKECVASARSDLSYVIFKKLEKVGEPIPYGLRRAQRYKVSIPVELPKDPSAPYIYYDSTDNLLYIGIKQNKENMEESVEEKLFCDKVAKANAEYMKVKLNSSLKPFNLEAAKAGKPVCTMDGRKARVICFDTKGDMCPIIALVEENGIESAYHYDKSGRNAYKKSGLDLMMFPEKKEGWVNVYKRENEYVCENECNVFTGITVFKSEGEAKRNINKSKIYVNTIKITWEV